MYKVKVIILFILCFLPSLKSSFADIYDPDGEIKRQQMIGQALDEYAESMHTNFDNNSSRRRRLEDKLDNAYFKDVSHDKFSSPKHSLESTVRNEVAIQLSTYHYETEENFPFYYDQLYSEPNDVVKEALMYGIYASRTWKIFERDTVRSWKDLFQNSPWPDFIRLEGTVSKGKIDYESFVTGKLKDFDAWKFDVRGLFGLNLPNNDHSIVASPYIGVGYRRSTEETGGWVDYFVYDYAEFPVKHSYLYIPIGLDTSVRVDEKMDVVLKLEGDVIFGGGVQYYLSEIEGTFPAVDAVTGEPLQLIPKNAKSDLEGGYGLKTSFKVIKKYEDFNVFVEPFFEFWHINQTDPEQGHSQATNGRPYVSVFPDLTPYEPMVEPENITREFGMRLGMQF